MNSEIKRTIEANKELKLGIEESEIYECEDLNLDRTIENLDKLLDPIIEDKFLSDIKYTGYGLDETININNYKVNVYNLGNGINGYEHNGFRVCARHEMEEHLETLENS